jgi:hypothetical protein
MPRCSRCARLIDKTVPRPPGVLPAPGTPPVFSETDVIAAYEAGIKVGRLLTLRETDPAQYEAERASNKRRLAQP